MTQANVIHDTTAKEFYIDLLDEQRAYVRYHLQEGEQVDFYKTFVPANHRAKGLAAMLVNHALDWAEQQQLEINTSCWYAEKKMAERNQQ